MDSPLAQKFREVEAHPDYNDSVERYKSIIQNDGVVDYVVRHIRDHLWKFSDTCPQVPGTNLFIYKPDLSPLIMGETAVLFTVEISQGREIVMLRDLSYSSSRDETADEEE